MANLRSLLKNIKPDHSLIVQLNQLNSGERKKDQPDIFDIELSKLPLTRLLDIQDLLRKAETSEQISQEEGDIVKIVRDAQIQVMNSLVKFITDEKLPELERLSPAELARLTTSQGNGGVSVLYWALDQIVERNATSQRALEFLLEKAPVSAIKLKTDDGSTLFYPFTQQNGFNIGDIQLFKLILEKGADINAKLLEGNTILNVLCNRLNFIDFVVTNQHPEIPLNKEQLRINYKNNDKICETMIIMLLNANANVNIANENGDTPLMQVSHRGQALVANALLAKGALTDMQNKNGDTALTLALHMNGDWHPHMPVVHMLLLQGADEGIGRTNSEGETAVQYIAKLKKVGKFPSSAELKEQCGAFEYRRKMLEQRLAVGSEAKVVGNEQARVLQLEKELAAYQERLRELEAQVKTLTEQTKPAGGVFRKFS